MMPLFIGKASLMLTSRLQGRLGVRVGHIPLRDATQSMSLAALTTRLSRCEFESQAASHRSRSRRLESRKHDHSLSKYGIVLGILNRGFPDMPSGGSRLPLARHIKLHRVVFRSVEGRGGARPADVKLYDVGFRGSGGFAPGCGNVRGRATDFLSRASGV